MMILVTGGSKSGKSAFAESLFSEFKGRKYYIAAMKPYGSEAFRAIEAHQKMRSGKGFETIEKYNDIAHIEIEPGQAVLLECIGNLTANEMFDSGRIIDPGDNIISGLEHLRSRSELFAAVTSEVSSDGIEYSAETMKYMEILGKINRAAAMMSDQVYECVYGIPLKLKG